MRSLILAASLASLAACDQPPAPGQPMVPAVTETPVLAPTAPRAGKVEGWETDPTAYARLGVTLPQFLAKAANGSDVTEESLRDRWTILGFMGPADADEARFVSALNSAVDQDPDLDLLMVQPVAIDADPTTALAGARVPTVADFGKLADAFRVQERPAYLLVGPDLTIEGYRGALKTSTDNGIKPVIRGVAEIRKQIAAPQ